MKSWKKTKQYILVIEFVAEGNFPTQEQIMENLEDNKVDSIEARAFHYLKKDLKEKFKT